MFVGNRLSRQALWIIPHLTKSSVSRSAQILAYCISTNSTRNLRIEIGQMFLSLASAVISSQMAALYPTMQSAFAALLLGPTLNPKPTARSQSKVALPLSEAGIWF